MNTLNADEVRAKYIVEFGDRDGPIVHGLTNKAINLVLRWNTFLYLFAGPKVRVETLNRASGPMAHLIQSLLWDDTLLRVRQLTDPDIDKSKNVNLSLKQLTRIAEIKGVDIRSLGDQTLMACEPARVYATKYLAHLDLPHALGDMNSRTTRGETTKAVKAIATFVREFHAKVRDTDQRLKPIRTHDAEGTFLLRLYQGTEAEKVLKAAALDAHRNGDWGAINRRDIPEWIHDRDDPLGDI